MYALQGRFERIERDERDLHKGSSCADDFQLYKATCGSCGCWQQIAIRPDLLEIAAYKLAPSDVFTARGWEVSRKRVRCPFCLGLMPRPEGTPGPLPEPGSHDGLGRLRRTVMGTPPEPKIVDLTLGVRP